MLFVVQCCVSLARVIKPGRQIAVVAADVFCLRDGAEIHTATALASIAMLDDAKGAKHSDQKHNDAKQKSPA